MIVRAVRTSLSIKVVTTIVLAIAAGLLFGGLFDNALLFGGAALGVIACLCYLLAPAAYEVSDGRLTVLLHAGKRCCGRIDSCSRVNERLPFTVRLFGNGGVFAGTGIFWNKRYGVFRVYVTSARHTDAVLIQTENCKVLITPEDPQAFVAAAQEPNRHVP